MIQQDSANQIFCLLFSLFICFTTLGAADDSIAMLKLASAIHPTPFTWSTSNATGYCGWDGVICSSSSRITNINLPSKNLSGILPAEVSMLSQLRTLSLENNNLSGPLPSLANLSFLQHVYLQHNYFNSMPESFFQGLNGLQVFNISYNNLSPWPISTHLSQCSQLIAFGAIKTNAIGSIPDIFSGLSSLQNLKLSFNNLTGRLPASFANSGIQNLWLNDQEMGLSGPNDVLSSMTQLKQVWLNKNLLTGSLPDLSKCENLFDLQLSYNRLTGLVPASLVSLPALQSISISMNRLQGPMPEFPSNVNVYNEGNKFCVDNARTPCDPQVSTMLGVAGALGYPDIFYIYWYQNNACDWRFLQCDHQNRIVAVDFVNLNLSGTISSEFSNLTALRTLLLNDNDLTGSIPDSLKNLTQLQFLDVSNNNLSGIVPNFTSAVTVVTAGNPFLRNKTEILQPDDANTTEKGHGINRKKLMFIIAGVVIPLVIFLTVMLFSFHYCNVKKRYRNSGMGKEKEKRTDSFTDAERDILGSSTDVDCINTVISTDVLREATNNFSKTNILGRGGFGVVYKGQLYDGTKIAVKRMEAVSANTKGINGFRAEIKVLTKVRHRHLVTLLGYCINRNEQLLVYEFMPKGTLAQHLFEWRECGFAPLSWTQRVTIALDVARGVEYLHSLAHQSFIHRDLKPSNILLGDDMRAKVADFGLVKHVPNGKYSLETRVAGTFGYLAPEYAATGKVTRKVDVYAFGAILMEMITGRKAIDETVPDEEWMIMHLVTWFRGVLINKKEILRIIDKTLNQDEETLLTICKVAELAEHCTSPEPNHRPDMSHVVNTLGPLVEHWKPPVQEQKEAYREIVRKRVDPQLLQRQQVHEDNSTTYKSMPCHSSDHFDMKTQNIPLCQVVNTIA